MTAIQWDKIGERYFEAGVDRGVLYLTDGSGVAWNGLISVSEDAEGNGDSPLFFDGVKYGDHLATSTYSGSVKAFTYPEEFLEFEGTQDAGNGLFVTNQFPKRFGLSYRTGVGNDLEGLDHGYKIHILYNLLASPSQKTFNSSSKVDPGEFEWQLTAIPGEVPGFRPTAHIILDTRFMSPLLIADIERTLYGTETEDPRLPPIGTLVSFIDSWVIIRITDLGDGSWTAEGDDSLITWIDATTFQIIQANVTPIDADSYFISDTTY